MDRFPINLSLIAIILLLAISSCSATVEAASYCITDYGAKPDGRTDSAKPFLSAWAAACGFNGSATINVPSGSFLLGQVAFRGPCRSSKITIQIAGSLVAPSGYSNFSEWIEFGDVESVSLLGGTIDGQGSSLWACKNGGKSCPPGASSLVFRYSKDIMISGLTSINSELYHIVIDNNQRVTVQGVKIMAPGNSPNTDGIHVQGSNYVTITSTGIKTGDDCVSVGPGTTNLWIEQVACGPGHGISIGSLGKNYIEDGVANVTVKTVSLTGTQNGLRIKTWGRPSEGFVKGVVFEHATMQNVQNPIIIDQNYCPHDKGCPNKSSGVKISEVTYSDVQGSSASQVAVNFDCSSSNPCNGIQLQDIKLTYGNESAKASCKNACGSTSGFVVPPSCL